MGYGGLVMNIGLLQPKSYSTSQAFRTALTSKTTPQLAGSVRFGSVTEHDPDVERFKQILDGKTRDDLKKFIAPGNMKISKDGKSLQIPMPSINSPRFMPGRNTGGVGSGSGEEGDELGPDGEEPGGKPGEAGDKAGDHGDEGWTAPISRSEIAKLVEEDLKLPNLKPKPSDEIRQEKRVWTKTGPSGIVIDYRSTLRQAISRTLCELSGQDVDIDAPDFDILDHLTITKKDLRFINDKIKSNPKSNCVIVRMRDYSGSMSGKPTELAKTDDFWLTTIIKHQFGEINANLDNRHASHEDFGNGVVDVFVLHDTEATEVPDEETYYGQSIGGGTMISSGFEYIKEEVLKKYPPENWNLYVLYHGDGDNWGGDNEKCGKLMDQLIARGTNMLACIHTNDTRWGGFSGGDFFKALQRKYGDKHPIVRLASISEATTEQIKKVLKTVFEDRGGGQA
jgi:uncharacterized protein